MSNKNRSIKYFISIENQPLKLRFTKIGVIKMITENVRKQLADYRKHGKKLKYLINYLMGLIDDEDDFENIIIREMKALAFNEDEIVECLEYHFGFDMSWHPMSVNYKKE